MIYNTDNYLVLDFETTNLDTGDARNPENKIVLACWWYKNKLHSIRGNEYEQQELVKAIEQCDVLVAQNVKFELQWLHRCGLDTTHLVVYDTQIAEYCIAGNRRLALDLGSIDKRYGGDGKEPLVDKLIKGGVCPSEIPESMLLARCNKDVMDTRNIFLKQRDILLGTSLMNVVWTRCQLTPVLADIELNGMCLDGDRVRHRMAENIENLNRVTLELREIMGDINPNSSVQMSEFMYDVLGFKEVRDWKGNPVRTPGGARKADIATISALIPINETQKRFLKLKLEQSKYEAERKTLEKMYKCVEEDGGILYANFNQTVARTHRLTSSGTKHKIQFQNMARAFKPLFCARDPDYEVGEADGAQLEFRVAVFHGRDKQGLEDILNKIDVHQNTADTLTNAGQSTDRQGAKEHTFKPLYGGESGTEAEQAYYTWFKNRYQGIAQTQQGWIDEVVNTKQLETCTGLVFYWPDTKVMSRSGYVTNRESICNYPVQMLATADIIPIALVALWRKMKEHGMKSFIVNTVHDSVIAEVFKEERELFKKLVVESFTTSVYSYLKEVYNLKWFVPLGAGIKISSNWSEGEEEKYESVPPYTLEGN